MVCDASIKISALITNSGMTGKSAREERQAEGLWFLEVPRSQNQRYIQRADMENAEITDQSCCDYWRMHQLAGDKTSTGSVCQLLK